MGRQQGWLVTQTGRPAMRSPGRPPTRGHARSSAGAHQPKPSTSTYAHSNNQVLLRPVESALVACLRMHEWSHHLEVTWEETREGPGDSAGASSGLVVQSGQEGWPRALPARSRARPWGLGVGRHGQLEPSDIARICAVVRRHCDRVVVVLVLGECRLEGCHSAKLAVDNELVVVVVAD